MVKSRKQDCQYVREPASATPDRHIKNQVELLIERCILVSADVPRVGPEEMLVSITYSGKERARNESLLSCHRFGGLLTEEYHFRSYLGNGRVAIDPVF